MKINRRRESEAPGLHRRAMFLKTCVDQGNKTATEYQIKAI